MLVGFADGLLPVLEQLFEIIFTLRTSKVSPPPVEAEDEADDDEALALLLGAPLVPRTSISWPTCAFSLSVLPLRV